MHTSENIVIGFSKLSTEEKRNFIAKEFDDAGSFIDDLRNHLHPDPSIQNKYEGFSENTISNFHLPFGIAPNFLINNETYHVPMVSEESSVVAAAASAAKFWENNGGFTSIVENKIKYGHIYFTWEGDSAKLSEFLLDNIEAIKLHLHPITNKMEKRGGGIMNISLEQVTELEKTFKLVFFFDTKDAMGANFINTCLENAASFWKEKLGSNVGFSAKERECEIIMSILSNHTPNCIVSCTSECHVKNLSRNQDYEEGLAIAKKMEKAFAIAQVDTFRAVTHNKGIYNGISAVALATGNDFRSIEAAGHAYASETGKYKSLSKCVLENDKFVLKIKLPVAIGTIGGVTGLHPLAKRSLQIMKYPNADQLMSVMAATGLASNYSAIYSLSTHGIQHGHMRMHLNNILSQLDADEYERKNASEFFQNERISYNKVADYLSKIRDNRINTNG